MSKEIKSLDLVDIYDEILSMNASDSDMKRENANINTNSPMGMMLKIGTESMKKYIDKVILPERFSKAEHEGWVRYHDKDFSLITFNCCQIDLKKILETGFHTGHGFVRQPQSIRSAATLTCIVIQSNQNDMYGGQSISCLDLALSEYVKKSFYKNIISHSYNALCYAHSINSFMSLDEFTNAMKSELDKNKIFYTEKDKDKEKKLISYKEISRAISKVLENYIFSQLSVNVVTIYMLACNEVEDETHQAMEAAVHNFCTLQSRAGSQTPFSSVNFGMDTSPEGRLVSKELLNAIDAGLGHGETVIFPISIFTLKSGINYNPEDPNYDLFIRACEVSAKRLFPNFSSVDASFNLPYYNPNDYRTIIAMMGCADGNEIVIYKLNDTAYCESFKRFWNRIKYITDDDVEKYGYSKYIDTSDLKLTIYDSDNGFVKVKKIIKNPDVGNWTRIVFSNGRSILVTNDHPLYTYNRGRVLVSELELGDEIETEYDFPDISTTNHSDASCVDIFYILGLIITDGCYDRAVSITLNSENELDIADSFIDIIESRLHYKCKMKFHNRGSKGNYLEIYVKQSSDLAKKLKDFFGGTKKNDRNINSMVFSSDKDIKLSFLAGMIDGDGHISQKGFVQIGSTNKELSLQQLALAQSCGYKAKLYLNHYTKKDNNKIRYRVEFPMSEEISKYMKSSKKINKQWLNKTRITDMISPNVITVKSIEHLGFLDKSSYDVETESDRFSLSFIKSGNCRTRVLSNLNGPNQCTSRGNFAFTTINLPKLAIEANGDIEKFFELFDNYIVICKDYLLLRLSMLENKHMYNYPFLMGQGIWLDSEKYKPNDTIKEVLKHASYSIGFCGLAECLISLIGKHHGESEEAQELGLKIIKYLRDKCDKFKEEYHMNWTCFATPAESCAGAMQCKNREQYGIIPGVTSKEYMTNSFHIPVYYKINAMKKIEIESPYHAYCDAGSISYVEMDGDPTKNLSAFISIVRAMHDADMGYFSINHPVDRDPVCGYTGVISNECPHCHRHENGIYEEVIDEL